MPKSKAFSVVEMLVVISVFMVLLTLLLPALSKARDQAMYVQWRAYSHALDNDSEIAVHFNFEDQTGEEMNKKGWPLLYNRAMVDAMKVTTSPGAEDGQGQLGFGNIATKPEWDMTGGRFTNKPALDFDGTDDFIAINKTYGKGELPAMTVAVWVMSENSASSQYLMSFDRSENFRFALKDGASNNVGFDTASFKNKNCCISDLRTSEGFTDGRWHLVVGTYDMAGTGNRKQIFVDGRKVATTRPNKEVDPHKGLPLGQGGWAPYTHERGRRRTYGFVGCGSEGFTFGKRPGPRAHLDGLIDEVVLLERALTPDEIMNMYKMGAPIGRR